MFASMHQSKLMEFVQELGMFEQVFVPTNCWNKQCFNPSRESRPHPHWTSRATNDTSSAMKGLRGFPMQNPGGADNLDRSIKLLVMQFCLCKPRDQASCTNIFRNGCLNEYVWILLGRACKRVIISGWGWTPTPNVLSMRQLLTGHASECAEQQHYTSPSVDWPTQRPSGQTVAIWNAAGRHGHRQERDQTWNVEVDRGGENVTSVFQCRTERAKKTFRLSSWFVKIIKLYRH